MSDQLRKNIDFAQALSRRTDETVTLYRARQAGTSQDAGFVVLFGNPRALIHGGYCLRPVASFARGRRVEKSATAVA